MNELLDKLKLVNEKLCNYKTVVVISCRNKLVFIVNNGIFSSINNIKINQYNLAIFQLLYSF